MTRNRREFISEIALNKFITQAVLRHKQMDCIFIDEFTSSRSRLSARHRGKTRVKTSSFYTSMPFIDSVHHRGLFRKRYPMLINVFLGRHLFLSISGDNILMRSDRVRNLMILACWSYLIWVLLFWVVWTVFVCVGLLMNKQRRCCVFRFRFRHKPLFSY